MFCNVEVRWTGNVWPSTLWQSENPLIWTTGCLVMWGFDVRHTLLLSADSGPVLLVAAAGLTEGVTWFTYCGVTRHVYRSGWGWYASRFSCDNNNIVISVWIQIMIIDKTIEVCVCVWVFLIGGWLRSGSMCFISYFFVCLYRVPTVPVKNLNGSSPVHPALAGEKQYANKL